MSLLLAVTLSAVGISAQHFQSGPSDDNRPTWSWTSTDYAPPSWSAQSPTWSPSLYTPETWSSPPPYTSPTWQSTWSAPSQPPYSAPWSPSSYVPHTWSSTTWPTSSYAPHSWPAPSPWPSPSPAPAPAPPPSLPSLNEALIAAGAAKFAALIQSDPVVSAAYAAGVPTVFAPTDQYIDGTFNSSSRLRRRTLTPQQQQQLLLSATESQSEINGLRTPPGKVVPTKSTNANLKGGTQKVVSDTRNKTNSGNPGKRWAPAILPRQSNSTSPPTLVNIFSGLGNSVGIITADIPFDGGLIHTTDGLFTVPLSLSETAQSVGATTFNSLAYVSNQTAVLDSTPLITVFVPTNDAFAAAGISTATSGIPSLLAAHVVPNFAGYIPSLTNGSTYTTQDGTTITVTIQGDDYYINNAKIVSSNLILENGVAHSIDTVLSQPIAPYTGAGSSILHTDAAKSLALSLTTVVFLAWLL